MHLDLPLELLPVDFVLLQVAVPDSAITGPEGTAETVATGNSWLTEARSASLRVPSALVPHAWNILLNPRHPDAARAEVLEIEPFSFDPRLWRPLAGEN